ncbi:centrosomal protein of 104 kDa isoform X1 [Takifugu flavidus]|uniref:centrosomal protein of 104 kDa isoform X1 n=2 Tax=Takifugu flavidus TaxID=433684 RepID=UPI0025441FEF|nr:centrosomal protein of 104 kDa isoform X1 [Takifugu flavidus]
MADFKLDNSTRASCETATSTGMPRKIGFTVVDSSSHEENFSASELMHHAPTVSGWRSSRLCSYPQHITLQLVERSRVRKLQLLAHQYLIPTKVEFHIGDTPPDASSPGFPGQLCGLGCVSLCNNENTSFKARELKSGHVDAFGTYLRITFHRNHVNRYNKYNQVALIAFNVLGETVDGREFNTVPSRGQLIEHDLNSTQLEATLDTFMGNYDSISLLDDLAFDMYQDPEVAHIIRVLDQKKQEAVRQENYEEAKNLKQAIADLQKVGEMLARYDVEKQCAIEKRDYELAKKKQELMEDYRRRVYQQLEVYNLLDMAMIMTALKSSSGRHPSSLQSSPGHCAAPTKALLSTETLRSSPQGQSSDAGSVAPHSSSLPVSPCSPSAASHTDVADVPYDERPLPTLQSPAEQHSPLSDTQRSPNGLDMSGEPEPLSEMAQRQAGLAVEVFGESLVACAYSKTWGYRESAMLNVYKKLLGLSPNTSKEELRNMIRAAVFLVKRALLDKVSPVFHAALKLLRLLLSQLLSGLGRTEMSRCLEQTWPSLLARTGGPSAHLRAAVTAFILEIAVLKDVRALHIIPGELVKPFRSSVPPRLAQSRVEMVEKLLAELGTENSGFTLENVMTFCTAAMVHSAPVVREVAVRIILLVYRQHGAAVVSYLPPRDAAVRKNFLYKTLFNEFAKIDGKLVETQGMGNEGDGETLKKDATKTEKHSQKEAAEAKVKGGDFQQSLNHLDKLCIFCGETDESFTDEGLDLHYWTHCPMLRHCDECKQVVEIASVTEHLLSECGSRSKFRQCVRCSEAVLAEDLPRHAQGPTCNPPTSGKASSHCPLCHNNFMPGDEAWKAHLMGRGGCKQNSRRPAASQRSLPAQGRAAGRAKMKQAWSVGAGTSPKGRPTRN